MPSDRTVRLHRVLRAPPERVYRAWLDPDAMAKWLAPHGFTGKIHEIAARVGGAYRGSFTNFSTGRSHSFGGTYTALVPHQRISYTDQIDDPRLSSVMSVTVTLRPVTGGTDLTVEQTNVPEAIPLEMCYLGWQDSLAQLAHLVEPEIQGGP